jgi:predicted transcriptional regulator
LNTLGDHLQKRRLDLGLTWKAVGQLVGAGATNVAHLSKGYGEPALHWWPGILRFLGYDPRPEATTLGAALVRHRQGRGQSQRQLAAVLDVDPATLANWERGARQPTGRFLTRANEVLKAVADAGYELKYRN